MLSQIHIHSWQALIRPPAPGIKPPDIPDVSLQALSCRQARVSVTAVLTSPETLERCRIEVSNLVRGKFHIPSTGICCRLVASTNIAGQGPVSDKLVSCDSFTINVSSAVVISIDVPLEIPAGVYQGTVKVYSDDHELARKDLLVEVADVVIPDHSDGEFSLNATLDPKKVAQAHNCEMWSDKHFELLSLYAQTLTAIGQRAIPVTNPYELVKLDSEDDKADLSLFKKFLAVYHQAGMGDYVYLYNLVESSEGEIDPDGKLVATLRAISTDIGRASISLPIYVVISEKSNMRAALIADYIRTNTPEFKILNIEHSDSVSLLRAEHVSTALKFDDNGVVEDDEVESNIKEIASILGGKGDIDDSLPDSELKLCHIEGIPESPGMFVHSRLVETRMLPFLAAQIACDGLSLFSYGDWPDPNIGDEVGGKENFLIYPSEDGPIISMRWLQLLEGIQDYELAMIALRRISSTEEMIDYQQALSLACRDVNGTTKSTGDIEIARRLLIPIASHSRHSSEEGPL